MCSALLRHKYIRKLKMKKLEFLKNTDDQGKTFQQIKGAFSENFNNRLGFCPVRGGRE